MYDDDELEGLRQPEKRIGHYGLFNEDDFVDAPKRTFSSLHSNCGYIDIGRYGPFLKEGKTRKNLRSGYFYRKPY
jgi:hypothetical protein